MTSLKLSICVFQPERMESLIDRKVYFPGWHMNKKHWYTMILDGSVERRELFRRIDESYRLAGEIDRALFERDRSRSEEAAG